MVWPVLERVTRPMRAGPFNPSALDSMYMMRGFMPALCLMISAGPSPPPPCGGRGWRRGSASLLDVLEREQAERALDEAFDLLAADVAEGAVVEVDQADLVARDPLQVIVHLLALGGVGLHPCLRHQVLHLVV